jgi:F0F1-type ATP synthase delta subunit
MALLLKHQTVEAFVARVRAAYRDGRPERVVAIARFIVSRVQAGDITVAQVRAAFGLTSAQWTALRTKMENLIAADNAVKSAVGE